MPLRRFPSARNALTRSTSALAARPTRRSAAPVGRDLSSGRPMARDVLREQEIVRRAARTRTVVADVALDRHDRESAEVRVQAGGRLEEQPRELGQAVVAEMPEMRRDEYAPRRDQRRIA